MKNQLSKILLAVMLVGTITLGVFARMNHATAAMSTSLETGCTTSGITRHGQWGQSSLVDCISCSHADTPNGRVYVDGVWYDTYPATSSSTSALTYPCVGSISVCTPVMQNPGAPSSCSPRLVRSSDQSGTPPTTGTGTGSGSRGGTIL